MKLEEDVNSKDNGQEYWSKVFHSDTSLFFESSNEIFYFSAS